MYETYVRSTKLSTGKVPMVERVLSTGFQTKENALPVFQLHEKNRPGQGQALLVELYRLDIGRRSRRR